MQRTLSGKRQKQFGKSICKDSSENLLEEERKRRESKLSQYPGITERNDEVDSTTNEPFTLEEMMRAIKRSKPASPGKD